MVSQIAGYAFASILLGLLVVFFTTVIVAQTAPRPSTAEIRLTHPINLVGIALLACVAGYVASVSLAIARLKRFHRETWQALECPAFLSGHSRFLEYIWARSEKELNDPRFTNFVTAMKIFATGFYVLFMLAALTILRP
jgi:hypothetical protein